MSPRPKRDKHVQSLYLEPDRAKLVDQLAEETRIPKAELLREAVDDLLAKSGKAPKGYEWVRERLPGGRGNRHTLKKKGASKT